MNIFSELLDGRLDVVISMLKNDPSLANTINYNQYSLLHYAVNHGSLELIELILDLGGNPNYGYRSLYKTPLNEAAWAGNTDVAKLLVARGALADGIDQTAPSPLTNAARNGHEETVQFLIEAGADVNRLGFIQRYFPLDFALSSGNEKCIDLIKRAGGVSVSSDYPWEDQPGFSIDAFVSNQIGPVYPLQLKTVADDVSIRLAEINVKANPKPLYLFTDEEHKTGGSVEFNFVLPSCWGVLSRYHNKRSRQAFPVEFIRRLSTSIKNGSLTVTEGSVFLRTDERWADLGWPDEVGALVAIDHQTGNDPSWVDACGDQNATILTLAPMQSGGGWTKGKSALSKAITSRKSATWNKLMIPMSVSNISA